MTAVSSPRTLDAPPAIELRGVHKRYGSTTAVDDLSLSVPTGGVFALLGPNGAGKTTTIEICEGFIKADRGDIRVLGLNPRTQTEELRPRIGVMLQGGGGYSGIHVRELLTLTAGYNAHPLDPEWLLTTLGLGNVAKTPYRRLSGGQQQRLSLALALIGRPELVFLDEPTAGMDAQSRLMVWDLIRALKRDGVTVVLTTHLMDEVEALADRVAIIDHGQLVAEGTPAEVTALAGQGAGELCIEFTTPINGPQFSAALKEQAIIAEDGLSLRITSSTPELIAAAAQAAAEQNVLISSLHTGKHNLEAAFLDITGRNLRS